MSLEDARFNTGPAIPQPFPYQKRLEIGIVSEHNAEAAVEEILAQGERPIVTFPREMLEKVRQHGLQPRKSWVPGFDKVVGTLGIPPYRDDPNRVAVRVLIDSPEQIQPRMTGKDEAFHGVIVFRTPITRDLIEFLGIDADSNQAEVRKLEPPPIN